MAIPREAGRVTYSTDIRNKKRIPLSEYQKAIAIGSILGDACLHGNWSKTNYRLQFRHSKDQKKYVEWKYEVFKNFVLTPPQYYDRTRSVWFRTISHPDLSLLHNVFYKKNKKMIPIEIETLLANPLTMAVWFMDDGNARYESDEVRAYHLNTQSFTRSENEILCKAIEKVWMVRCAVHDNHGYSRLYIGARDKVAFASIVRPFILPSLMYKIG